MVDKLFLTYLVHHSFYYNGCFISIPHSILVTEYQCRKYPGEVNTGLFTTYGLTEVERLGVLCGSYGAFDAGKL